MDKLTETIKNRAKEGKITCEEALQIAEKLSLKPIEVGRKIDELKIKIKQCQLGCFK